MVLCIFLQVLMSVIAINGMAEFDKLVKEKACVVDFYADWCGPCQKFAPTFARLAKEFPNVHFLKVNVDNNKDLANRYSVSALPTFAFFNKGSGSAVKTLTGASGSTVDEITSFASANSKTAFDQSGGHRLDGGSTGTYFQQQQQTAGGKRVNPWADPNFKPPGSSVKK